MAEYTLDEKALINICRSTDLNPETANYLIKKLYDEGCVSYKGLKAALLELCKNDSADKSTFETFIECGIDIESEGQELINTTCNDNDTLLNLYNLLTLGCKIDKICKHSLGYLLYSSNTKFINFLIEDKDLLSFYTMDEVYLCIFRNSYGIKDNDKQFKEFLDNTINSVTPEVLSQCLENLLTRHTNHETLPYDLVNYLISYGADTETINYSDLFYKACNYGQYESFMYYIELGGGGKIDSVLFEKLYDIVRPLYNDSASEGRQKIKQYLEQNYDYRCLGDSVTC